MINIDEYDNYEYICQINDIPRKSFEQIDNHLIEISLKLGYKNVKDLTISIERDRKLEKIKVFLQND